jgi:hypothetical protein
MSKMLSKQAFEDNYLTNSVLEILSWNEETLQDKEKYYIYRNLVDYMYDLYQESWEEGSEDGYENGYESGYSSGYDEGMDELDSEWEALI